MGEDTERVLDQHGVGAFQVKARWCVDIAHEELFATVAALDKRLFDAFNARGLDELRPLFGTDLEFFHDKGGLTGFQ